MWEIVFVKAFVIFLQMDICQIYDFKAVKFLMERSDKVRLWESNINSK